MRKYKFIKYIKENILYYIINWYSTSWFYYNIIKMMSRFRYDINVKCMSKNEALRIKNRKIYKWLPNSFKNKIIKLRFG